MHILSPRFLIVVLSPQSHIECYRTLSETQFVEKRNFGHEKINNWAGSKDWNLNSSLSEHGLLWSIRIRLETFHDIFLYQNRFPSVIIIILAMFILISYQPRDTSPVKARPMTISKKPTTRHSVTMHEHESWHTIAFLRFPLEILRFLTLCDWYFWAEILHHLLNRREFIQKSQRNAPQPT